MQNVHIDWEELDLTKLYTIGPALFLGVRVITYPPTVVKTRLQAQVHVGSAAAHVPKGGTALRQAQYSGTMDCFRTMIRTEGALSLWRGFMPKLVGLVGGQAYIGCYEFCRSRLIREYECRTSVADLIAGAAASLVSQTVVVPTDLISQRAAVDLDQRSATAHVRAVWREAGVVGFYRGYWASLATYMPASAVWWATYGAVKPYFAGPVARIARGCKAGTSQWTVDRLTEACCGAVAGATAGLVTTPMDVVKVRRQLAPNDVGTLTIIKELARAEGASGFARGAAARVMNMAPSGALVVTVYELVKRMSLKDTGSSVPESR